MNQLGGLLQQYAGARPDRAPSGVEDDFDQFAQAAPPSAVSDGLAAAFRSDQTPPFGNMAAQLFGRSDGRQKAGILNALISAVGPMIVSQMLARRGGPDLGGLLGGGRHEVTPEVAEQVPPEVVEEIASQAEQKDPSVIDRLSEIYAQHPTLIKTLGGAALAIALAKVAQAQNRGAF
jgi:hypothetical protein